MVGLHHGRAPGPAAEVHPIRSAAAVEAMAWGHREVDVDHLLLGLVVVAGPSALELAGAGADLAALRGAVARVRADGGADVAPRSVVRAADRRDAAGCPSPGRRAACWTARRAAGTTGRSCSPCSTTGTGSHGACSATSTSTPPPCATGSPTGAGWPGAPRTERRGPSRPHRAPLRPAPPGSTAPTPSSCPCRPERVWALLGDPSRRPEWDPDCVAVTVAPEGAELLTRPDGTVVSQTVHDTAVGRTLARHRHDPGGPSAGPVRFLDVLRVVVAPDGARTAVGLRRDRSGRGVAWRLARPALSGLVRTQLRICLHAIHQAAA